MDIPQLTTAVWQLIQPYLPLLAAKGGEELGKRAVGEVWEAVKGRFAQKDETKKLTDKLLAEPGNPAVQGAFQYHLQDLLEADADFARALAALVEAAGGQYQAVVHGCGAVAQGPGAKAVGAGGVLIEGDVRGSAIISGDNNEVKR